MLASPAALLNHRNPPLVIISFRSPKPRRGLRIRSDLRPPLLLSATSSAPSPKLSSIPDTLRVLEWHKLCDCVASFAGTSLGREATKKKLLSLDVSYEQSIHLLQETAAAVEILNSGVGGMDFGGIDTDMVKSAIEHASRGFPINGKEAIAVASIIQSVDLLQTNLKALTEDADWYHRFMPLTEPILDLPVTGTRAFINSVHQVIDEEGSVKDTASSELKHLREQLRTTETKLYYLMEKLAKPETMEGSSSEIITINGRWCLKVASDQFTKHEGLLLTSGAGSESLVEPLAAIPLNDELQRTRSLATRAEEDVLSKLTDKMLEVIDDIESLLDSTIQLDVVIARAQYSIRYGGTYPDLFPPEDKVLVGPEASSSVNRTPEAISKPRSKWKFYARGAYHPLLLQQHHEKLQMAKNDIDVAVSEFRRMRLQGHDVLSDDDIESTIAALKLRVAKVEEDHPVPVDFTISVKTRVVVVTGPNTGGKTASLKTVGLAALMAKIGLYVLASEPVQMPWFDAIYVDIGDEQSLSQSLSTFSSHLKRISAIRSNSTEQSLVLLDEVGAGTNPLEGAALGMSLLESFAESCAFLTIATTHHGELKTLKYSNNLFENACMEFDEVILRPTYRILWGVPEMEPGPSDPSILHGQPSHRSTDIWDGEVDCIISAKRREYMRRRRPHQRMLPYLHSAGFQYLLEVPMVRLDLHLVTALVERWRPETHTFHLPPGEMTITLSDVACILGLPVDAPPLIGPTNNESWTALCMELLGTVPEKFKGARIKLNWLDQNFDPNALTADSPEEVVQYYSRAYILQILGGMLLADKSGDYVSLIYLPFLRDFQKYSWGSACLAYVYRQLCQATSIAISQMGGCVVLIQLWAWEYLPFIAPNIRALPEWGGKPIAAKWKPASYDNFRQPTHDLKSYRNMLDVMTHEQVEWMPYAEHFVNELPHDILDGLDFWHSRLPLICFHIIEHCYPDRCIRQFGGFQEIPRRCNTDAALHSIDLRGEKK